MAITEWFWCFGTSHYKILFSKIMQAMEYFGIKELSDIILEVENHDESLCNPIQFACHKVILAEASTTFKNIVCKEDLKVGLYLA